MREGDYTLWDCERQVIFLFPCWRFLPYVYLKCGVRTPCFSYGDETPPPTGGIICVKIDKWYPSSKRCFECGHILDSLTLDIREWTCPECGVHHDRDINAARNIHAVGLTVFEACGEAVRPGAVKANPGKPR